MTYSSAAGLGVNNFYGARDTLSGVTVGSETTNDSTLKISISFTGAALNDAFITPVVIPKGALLRRAVLRVDEAFVLGGTTPTVLFGAVGAEVTNGIVLSEAELETIGTKVPASAGAGTWATNSATGVAAAAKVGKALGGTTPTVTSAGKATLNLEFYNKTKV